MKPISAWREREMRGVSILPGVMIASFSAGPLFILAATAPELMQARSFDVSKLAMLIAFIGIATPIGMIIALLPNLAGAALLAALGRDNVAMRLPAIWALCGGLMGAAIGSILSTGMTTSDGSWLLSVVGLGNALVSRHFTVWHD